MKKNIAVITGGKAAELSISLKSADNVYEHLDRNLFDVYKIIIQDNDWVVANENTTIDKNDFTFSKNGQKIVFDAVFVAIHGTPAEDGKLQGYFDMMGVKYNCCGVLQAALTFDKNRTKEYLRSIGILSPQSAMLCSSDSMSEKINLILQNMSLPLFVKPNKNGSSYGAAKVDKADALEAAITNGFQYDDEILVEEFISGTEVTCGCMTINGVVTPMPITEIRSKKAFFDFQAKYEGASQEITPAEISPELTIAIQTTVKKIYEKLDFKGMCRIDFIIREGQYYMLEVNAIPGLSAESIIPQQARCYGMDLTALFTNSILECLR